MICAMKLQSSSDLVKSVIRRSYECNRNIFPSNYFLKIWKNNERNYSKNISTKNLQVKENLKVKKGIEETRCSEQMVTQSKKPGKNKRRSAHESDSVLYSTSRFDKKQETHTYYNSSSSYDSTLLIENGSVAKFVENLIDGSVPSNLDLMDTKINCDKHSNTVIKSYKSSDEISEFRNKIKDSEDEVCYSKCKTVDMCNNFSSGFFDNFPSNKIRNANKLTDLDKLRIENWKSGRPENELTHTDSFNTHKKLKETYSGPKPINQIHLDSICNAHELFKFIQCSVDVAISNNTPDVGLSIVKAWLRRKTFKQITNWRHPIIVDTFNSLLHVYADNWNKICAIRNIMKIEAIPHNYQTYAALLDSLGRNKVSDIFKKNKWKNEIKEVLKLIEENKLNLNEIFTKTILTRNQCENILYCIREIVPDFEIAPTTINLNHECTLLKDLFSKNNKLESQLGINLSPETLSQLINEQLELEKKSNIEIPAVPTKRGGLYLPEEAAKCIEVKKQWRNAFQEGLKLGLEKADRLTSSKKNINSTFFLKLLPTKDLVDIMLNAAIELVEYSGGYSPNIKTLQKALGDQIYQCYQTARKEKIGIVNHTKEIFQKYCEWYLNPVGVAKNSRQQWQMLVDECPDSSVLNQNDIKWPDSVKISVGKFLYDIIFNNAKIIVKEGIQERRVPVFYALLRRNKENCVEEIKCHPTISRLFLRYGLQTIHFNAIRIPMLCPPKPWTSVSHGGYLISPVEFTRCLRETVGKRIDFNKVPVRQLYPTFDSLNALQAVPWVVNKPVLDVALELFKNGGCPELGVPEYPDQDTITVNITEEMTSLQRAAEYTKKKFLLMERQNKYGLWCEALYRLSLANHFRNRIFWLPQNFDFRGRVYPVPPHLNHIGGDLFRSLLIFAKGKPLGPEGLDWIKVHTINLVGSHKRQSRAERLNYANEILPQILDSAERPLTGDRWWTTSEEPWQTLASCIEIKKALESGDVENFVSQFPIHQDGSCNGLQHYAALGRDSIGAKSVNLAPCLKPQDVYTDVIEVIEKLRSEDADNGIEIAKCLEGFIQRKIVKQTIMTSVYGVTNYGARQQIASKLQGYFKHLTRLLNLNQDIPDFPKNLVWRAAGYLTIKTFQSLQQMFSSAKQIQDWFIQCATTICSQNDYVQWISPLGLPIIQPYAKKIEKKKQSHTREPLYKPNLMKQKNAFPPNFVHSLDSTHMMLTSLFCEQSNLTFASIHDCYWTHPSTVEAMNKICREQFISLYSQPILEDLTKFFIEQFGKDKGVALQVFCKVPEKGNFNINAVSNSPYFFS